MNFLKRIIVFLAVFFCINANAESNKPVKGDVRQHPLDIVFCLDLSGSTNGLIDDVREQLWTIINHAHEMEPMPDLRIGIVGFSRPSFGKDNAYVKVLSYLTNDFDSIAYELYKLRPAVEQGDQYVNAALVVAMNDLNWGKEANNTKLIFIAGNGMASIRGVDLDKTAELLNKQKMIVNSLFVLSKGNSKSMAISGWKRIADLTHGLQSEIAVGKKEAVTDLAMNYNTLIDLNHQLNQTYIYHGERGKANYRRMKDLDSALNLSGLGDYYQRVWYKKSSLFQNTLGFWDLVDYIKSPSGYIEKIDVRTLTDSLQFYTPQQLNELALSQKDKRDKILRDINELFQNNFIQSQHQKYLKHEFPDSNIFSRCVINMMLEEWK